MKKTTTITTLLGACALLTVGTMNSHAATIRFNGADAGNNLFSDGDNWIEGNPAANSPYNPVAGDGLSDFYSGSTSSSNRAQVDSSYVLGTGDGTGRLGFANIKQLSGGTGTAYVEVLNGGTLHATTLTIGQTDSPARLGDLIVRTGGTLLGGNTAQSGALELSNQSGNILTIEAGATYGGARLTVGANSVLEVQAGASSISIFDATRTSSGSANTFDGLLRLDLGALNTTGSFTLVNSDSADLLIAGNLKTWLDGNSGTRSGTGNFSDTYFAIENAASGLDWSLTTADSGQDLVLNVSAIPEPSSAALLGAAALTLVALRRRR